MNKMPVILRKRLALDPFYSRCAREGGECEGRITWEHALYIKGRQLQEWWAIVPLCIFHHLGRGLDKRYNEWVALNRAPIRDMLENYPKAYMGWQQRLKYLNKVYGKYDIRETDQGTIYRAYH